MNLPTPTKGIKQRRLGGPDVPITEQGDCWATAVACYGDLSDRDRNELHRRIVLSDLALRRSGRNPQEGGRWWDVTMDFLVERGRPQLTVVEPEFVAANAHHVFIASGPSPRREFHHSILANGHGDLFWDPHPQGVGLPEIEEWIAWWLGEQEVAA